MNFTLGSFENATRQNKNFPFYIYHIECQQESEAIFSHWHCEFEILFCLSEGVAKIDDYNFKFKCGDIIFVNTEQIHNLHSAIKGEIFAYVFNFDLIDFKNEDNSSVEIIAKLRNQELLFPRR